METTSEIYSHVDLNSEREEISNLEDVYNDDPSENREKKVKSAKDDKKP